MTGEKKEQLIRMVSDFCDENLNDEYKEICVKLVEKLSRKYNAPLRRGKMENWASGILYAIAQINFLFDTSQEISTSPDEICDYFATKKSTASNKARDIRKMFDMGHFDEEFSSQSVLDKQPRFVMNSDGFIMPEAFLAENSELESIMDKIRDFGEAEIPDDLNDEFLTTLVNSTLYCVSFFDGITFIQTECGHKFFPFFTSHREFSKTFPDVNAFVPLPFYDFCEVIYKSGDGMDFEGVKLNPYSQDFFISCEMMKWVYEIFD